MLTKFDRLLPVGGVTISPDIVYRDVNDIGRDEREYVRDFFLNDAEYNATKLPVVMANPRRQYCAYVYKDGECVGTFAAKEYMTNLWNFGIDDFYYAKRVFPKFRRTKYSRYASADFIHMMFMSGLARNMYAATRGSGKDGVLWEAVDTNSPCMGVMYPTDGPDVQKYIKIISKFDRWVILHLVGVIYRHMDLFAYMNQVPGRNPDVVNRWLYEMDLAAKAVRETVCLR